MKQRDVTYYPRHINHLMFCALNLVCTQKLLQVILFDRKKHFQVCQLNVQYVRSPCFTANNDNSIISRTKHGNENL